MFLFWRGKPEKCLEEVGGVPRKSSHGIWIATLAPGGSLDFFGFLRCFRNAIAFLFFFFFKGVFVVRVMFFFVGGREGEEGFIYLLFVEKRGSG